MTSGGAKRSLGHTNNGRDSVAASPYFSRQIMRLIPPFILLTMAVNFRRLQTIAIDLSCASPSSGPSITVGVPPQPFLEIDKVCPPASSKINSANDRSPPSKVMHLGQVREAAKRWYEINCPFTCNKFSSLGQHLLQIAIQRNSTLLTVQVGAMDGYNNDPMHGMFVKDQKFKSLTNWLPVLIEPVPANFEALIETYAVKYAKDKGLGCAVPIHGAVSYDNSNGTSCRFCRINTADDAPPQCKELPDWARFQLGTLDCDYSRKYFRHRYPICIIEDPLPCSTISNLLLEKNVPRESIAMLQIDIEGYEYILFEGFFKEMPDDLLPPIIHFEQKVMTEQDRKYPLEGNSTRIGIAKKLLWDKGYELQPHGEDVLAFRL